MTTLKNLKGTAIQFRDEDPVVNAGTWASGGAMNTAREVQSGAGIQTSAIAAGGNTPGNNYAIVEEYNGSAWSEVADLNSARNTAGGFGANAEATICYGGRDPGGTRAYTEFWNGSAWTEVNDMNAVRFAFAGPGVGTSTSGMAVAGSPGDTLVETWDGTNWTEVAEVNTRRTQGGAAGAANTAAIAFGGYDDGASDYTANAEVWNGSAWTEVNNLNTKRSSNTGSGTSTAALCMSGRGPSPTAWARTESWDGTSWTEVADLATARYDGASGNSSPSTTSIMFAGKSYDGVTIFYALTEEWSFPPPTASIVQEGDMWFNSNTSTLKGYGTAAGVPAGSWASGGSLNDGRSSLTGIGIQTAVVAVSGQDSTTSLIDSVEEYNGTAWTEVNDTPVTLKYHGAGGILTAGWIAGGLTTYNGTAFNAETFEYDGTNWTDSGNINTNRYTAYGGGPQTAAFIAGGNNTSFAAVGNTELYNGSAWSETTDLNTARNNAFGNGTQTDGIYAGGSPGNKADTELWNGTTWTEVNNLNTARHSIGVGGGTAPGSSSLAVGGTDGTNNLAVVESWNGTSWTEQANLAATNSSNGLGISGAASAINFGGFAPSPSTFATVTEEWTVPEINQTITVS